MSKTAAVEKAVDRLLQESEGSETKPARIEALLAQLDRIPDRADAFNPLEWDNAGLPK